MKPARKTFLFLSGLIKAVITAAGSLSLIFSGPASQASTPATRPSPLLAMTQETQATITMLAENIRQTSAGSIMPTNIHAAIAEAAAANPGATLDMLAAAINRLPLDDASLSAAITSAGEIFDARVHDVVTALITDHYMTQGRDAAQRLSSRLRMIAGDEIVDQAFHALPAESFQTIEELRQIQPASGVLYDG